MKKIKFGIIGLGNQGSYYELRLFKEGGTLCALRFESRETQLCKRNVRTGSCLFFRL